MPHRNSIPGALKTRHRQSAKWNCLRSRIACCLLSLSLGMLATITLSQGQSTNAMAQESKQPVVDAPLAPLDAARTMVVPEGFHVSLFAGEPDCQQPIGFCIDDRGRLWVAEAYNYPNFGTKLGDRIVIFEDVDGDGHFDKRTVFYDKLNYITGIEVGFGGAWVMSPPNFYFIPDRDGDDRPDGEPEVLLDGFGTHANAHNLANGFSWGPDGWLYGTHGRTNWSLPAKPGTPKELRTQYDGGVYRYHPIQHVWEPYADGTTNPWGIDWNDLGEAFICNCVNPHLFHVIPGAHYEPWRNRVSSQYAYQRIPTIADHLHFVGKGSVQEGLGSAAEDAAGGGHAHCGTLIYLGDNWPDRYRNTLFTNNIHGRRINNDLLRRHGSGYTASHGPDLMRAKDPWYMGVTLRTGPDGSVFASDWSDTGECHSVKNTRRETGRIYKISYGKPSAPQVHLERLSDLELVELQMHRNDWFVQHARRLLQEHATQGRDLSEAAKRLTTLFNERTEVPQKLRALWALQVVGKLTSEFLLQQLDHEHESIRAWAIRLLCENGSPSKAATARFQELALMGDSALVRLYLASMLQRLRPADRWSIAEALLQHGEDAQDDNLPLMIWYAIEPLVHEDLNRFIGLTARTKIPLVARHIARRVASIPKASDGFNLLIQQLMTAENDSQSEMLAGMIEGLEGRRAVTMPPAWRETYAKLQAVQNPSARERSLQLALIFDDPTALEMLRRVAADKSADADSRARAIQALVSKRSGDVATLLLELASDPATRRVAIRGLAEFDHPETSSVLLKHYDAYDTPTKQDVAQTLASRLPWAIKLLDALEAGQVSRNDITAYTARQLYNLNDKPLLARLKSQWGELRTSPAEKTQRIASYKRNLTPEVLKKADRGAGRALFQKTCASCHRFFDAGGSIGPDITGAQRTNLDYLLQTLVDPSATVAKDYQMQVIETTGGRVITGLIVSETKTALTIQTVNEKVIVPIEEIEARKISDLSIMPEGMLQNLTSEQIRNLIAYLMGPEQVPLPVEKSASNQ
jgi:putative membrane-bound dehydrogenase-like protein